jgi:hypothetical protein
MPSRRWLRWGWGSSSSQPQGHGAAPDRRLDLGGPDGYGGRQFALDPPAQVFGPWSPIHLLSIMVLALLPIAVVSAHRHHVRRHSRIMIGVFSGGLVIAGLFTLLPGRIMHAVIFGQPPSW